MNKHRIYLCGGISNMSIEEHNGWRLKFEEFIENADLYDKVTVFNPVSHISELSPFKMDDKQAMDYDLHMLRNSDLIIANFNNPKSIGSACELGIAYEKRIPILGLNEQRLELHPWICMMSSYIFTEWEWMINYFVEHYYNEW